METLADRVLALRKATGLTQQQLAKKMGVSQNAIQKIESGQTKEPKHILALASALSADPHWLQTGNEISEKNEVRENFPELPAIYKNSVVIPLLDIYAAAALLGTGIINPEYPEVIKEIVIDRDSVVDLLGRKSANGINLINVPTDSMTPTINKGDVAFIDTNCRSYIGEGVYVFTDADGALYIKRLQQVPGGTMKILSDNKNYETISMTIQEFSSCYIMGKFLKALPLKMVDL